MKNILLIALLAISPVAMASQQSVDCRDQANVARSVVQSLKAGLPFEVAYQKVKFMPFNNEGELNIKSFVQGYYMYRKHSLNRSLSQAWHVAYMSCMPTYTYQTVRLPNGTYTSKETPISAATKKAEEAVRYIPPAT